MITENNKKYRPRKGVINFLKRALSDNGGLDRNLYVITAGQVSSLDSLLEEINKGTDLGRRVYHLVETVYDKRIKKKSE